MTGLILSRAYQYSLSKEQTVTVLETVLAWKRWHHEALSYELSTLSDLKLKNNCNFIPSKTSFRFHYPPPSHRLPQEPKTDLLLARSPSSPETWSRQNDYHFLQINFKLSNFSYFHFPQVNTRSEFSIRNSNNPTLLQDMLFPLQSTYAIL